jgi:serine/threonine-protein phosphatase 4 regulatory subunit 4
MIQKIIRVAMEKGDVSQTPGSRLTCCFVLGAITAMGLLSAQDIEGLYFQKLMALCQDTDAEVRKCMCIQLDGLARAVGGDKACSELLPELLELLQDEEEQVKQNAFLSLVSLLDFFPANERTKRIIPQILNIVESNPDYLIHTLAEKMGILVTKLSTLNHFTSDVASVFLKCLTELYANNEDKIRGFCAYNFPAFLKAFGNNFYTILVEDLLVKISEKVRLHIAAGIHEVANLMGQVKALRYLKPLVLILIKDESVTIQGMILSRMPQLMLSLFGVADEEQKLSTLEVVLKTIATYQSSLPASRNRDQIILIETLGQFPLWCTSEQIYEVVIPIIFELIEAGSRPVQLAAMQILVKCIRRNEVATHRYALLSKLRNEYGHSRSYWRRLLYLDACVFALEINSRQYCRLNFLDIAIDLIEDPIPNVRLKAVLLLSQWKNILNYLSDDKMMDRIKQYLEEATTSENDRDVANAIAETKVVFETKDSNTLKKALDDTEDKRKVTEEENLSLISDHEDSSTDAKLSGMLEYTLIVGKDGQVVRRARVKSLDLINKMARSSGKDTSRTGPGGLSSSVGISIGVVPSSSKIDSARKQVTKAPGKLNSANVTTLPNFTNARNPSAKQVTTANTIKSSGSSSKINISPVTTTAPVSSSVTALKPPILSPTRGATNAAKDAGNVVTKIPIIRPTAPAKRENSPSSGVKPCSINSPTSSTTSGFNVSNGNLTSSGVGNTGPNTAMKTRLGTIDSNVKPKAAPVKR